jgi:hypothetical protein
MQRRILAISAIVLFVIAGMIWLWRPGAEVWLAVCWRGGAVLAAAWLAYDDVQRIPTWLLLTLPVVLIVMLRRPVLLWLAVPLLILLAAMRRARRGSRL